MFQRVRRSYFELISTLSKAVGIPALQAYADKKYFALICKATVKLADACAIVQDHMFPTGLRTCTKLMVLVIPEYNVMSGGVYSIFSIASYLRRIKNYHGFEVVVMTRSNDEKETYIRNDNFINFENIFRFEQISLCKSAKEVYLHIPEYMCDFFVDALSEEEIGYLRERSTSINILNQNICMMPGKRSLAKLRQISASLSQSVAHHAYFNAETVNAFGLPTLLLPAYTDLSNYPAVPLTEKSKLIIYSPDNSVYKEACLARIRQELPDFMLQEIRGITFDAYMEFATSCLFSITFGEGFDGYLAQPIHQGGIGFAIYDGNFFPDKDLAEYFNIFADGEQMVNEICNRIRALVLDSEMYLDLNRAWMREYSKLYNLESYREQIRKLALKQFELCPDETDG